jgi:hypothetical protein
MDAMRAECGGVPKQATKGDLSATTQVKRISNERVPAIKMVEFKINLVMELE